MVFRAVYGRLKAGAEGRMRRFYRTQVIPALTGQKGFVFCQLLENTDGSGEFISVTAWRSPAAAQAYHESKLYKELLGKISDILVGRGRVKFYKIAVTSRVAK